MLLSFKFWGERILDMVDIVSSKDFSFESFIG